MARETFIALIVGAIIGIGATLGIVVVRDNSGPGSNSRTQVSDHRTMSMDDMVTQLESLRGDDFDKAFIEMMVVHHEGAVDMAELIPDRAKHQQLKELGEAIISAQNREILDMKQWQRDWGYSASEPTRMMH